MFYVYVLLGKNDRMYTGYTGDLRRRFNEHNLKKGGSYSSKNAPFKLLYYEAFVSKQDAMNQELFYKTGHGREVVREKIKDSLKIVRD